VRELALPCHDLTSNIWAFEIVRTLAQIGHFAPPVQGMTFVVFSGKIEFGPPKLLTVARQDFLDGVDQLIFWETELGVGAKPQVIGAVLVGGGELGAEQ
jgi:hypothetical protein